jgi:hypothetical protein
MVATLIDAYELRYPSQGMRPTIFLMNSGNLVGLLTFYPNATELPPDNVDQTVYLYYHLEDFENCAALLRNQKTVYMNYNGTGATATNSLQTGATIAGT